MENQADILARKNEHAAGQCARAAVVVLALALHLFFILSSFDRVEDLVNDRPVVNVDFASQYAWAFSARRFMEKDGRLWGYDPFFMAGYPLDFVFNSALPVQLAGVVFNDRSLARVIKCFFILSFLAAPFCLYYGFRQFGLSRDGALAGAGLALVYFWLGENGLFGRFGMLSGALMFHFFLVPAGLFYRFLAHRQNRAFSLLLFAFPAAFTVHKTAFVLVLAPSLLWLFWFSGRLSPRELLMVVGLFLFAFLLNFHWLYPFFKFAGLKIENPGTTFFQNLDPWRLFKDLWPFQEFYALPLARIFALSFGAWGLLRLRKERSLLFAPLVSALLFFGLLVYFGSFLPPLRHLQPYRYSTPYFYLWILAAGFGLEEAWRKFSPRGRTRWAGLALYAVFLAALLLMPSYRQFNKVAPLTTRLDPASQSLLNWLRKNTDTTARILMEDINVWDREKPTVYGGARLVHLVPILTGRMLVGGPLPNAFILHHYAGFHEGRFLGRPLSRFSDQELSRAFRLYNLGWVVCWSEEAKSRFDRFPEVERIADFHYLRVYRAKRVHGFALEGGAEVSADWNRVRVERASTGSGRLVISYHWVEGLRSEPRVKLTRVMLGHDPAGFIGIHDPPPRFELFLGPRPR